MGGQPQPAFIERDVARSGTDQVEMFLPGEDVIPHRSPTEVYVEVCVGVLHAHNAILLDLRFSVLKNTGTRPDVVHPTQFSGHKRRGQDLKNVTINLRSQF